MDNRDRTTDGPYGPLWGRNARPLPGLTPATVLGGGWGAIFRHHAAGARQVHDDDKLKSEIRAISLAARTFMKNVIVDESGQPAKGFDHAVRHLTVMREEIAAIVARLSDTFAVPVPPALQSQVWRDF